MPNFYIYLYRDPSRGDEPIYVGKGCGNRAYKHLSRKDKHPFTQRLQLMEANGIEPDIEIVAAIDEGHAYFMEECCIQVLGRKDLGKGTLLNLNDGGKGGMSNPSAETRKKLSYANKGKSHSPEHRQKQSDAMKGKSHSPEHRKKMSDAKKGQGKGIPRPRITCPHCGKEGGDGNMHRWHFDNCKHKAN